jgi:hypothetical protein
LTRVAIVPDRGVFAPKTLRCRAARPDSQPLNITSTTISTLAAACLLAGATLAQSTMVLPAEYDLAWGRGSTAALAGNTTRTQLFFVSPFAPGSVLTGFGLRAAPTTVDRASFTADIEVRVSSTAAVPGSLSTTWTNNVGNDEVVVLPRQVVTIPAMPANRGTGSFAEITFAVPFVFGTNGNTNLCIDLLVYGRSTGATWSTDRAFAATGGRVITAGIGCGAGTIGSTSTGGTYVSGATVTVTLANAPASSLALLLPSFDQKEFSPGVPLPFSLAPFGTAPGCDLLVNPSLGSLAFVTDVAGAASSQLTIPGGFGQFGLGWQWVYSVPPTLANPIGFETTANRAMWLGPEVVLPAAQYAWNLSSVTSATATSVTTDSVPVTKLMYQ